MGSEDAETYLVGFWTDWGSCSPDIRDFLRDLQEKGSSVWNLRFRFGDGGTRKIEERVKRFISRIHIWDVIFSGKMPMHREGYRRCCRIKKQKPLAERLIRNFDEHFCTRIRRFYGSDHFCEKVCDGKGILKKTADGEGDRKKESYR